MRLVVDSSFRDKSLWPNADSYEVRLSTPIRALRSIRLVESDVSFKSKIVDFGVDRLYIRTGVGNRVRSVQVEHGDYTDGQAIAAAVQQALDTQAADVGLTISYTDSRITFSSAQAFSIDDTGTWNTDSLGRPVSHANSDSMARVLGLETNRSYTASDNAGQFELRAAYDVSMAADRYLVLFVDVAGDLMGTDSGIEGALSTVTPGSREYLYNGPVSASTQRTVDRLRIKLCRPSGARYNFNGNDHRLEFCVSTA